MLNYETILSSYDDKMTLMQWLKKVEEALKHASATAFRVSKKGNATISFILDFEDGTTLESGDIVLQQGESVNGAYIENNHLFITLTNGQVIDAGLMFNGDLTINGTLDATKVTGNEIVEKMSGYSYVQGSQTKGTLEVKYCGAVKNGNKLTLVVFGKYVRATGTNGYEQIGRFTIPSEVATKIIPFENSEIVDGRELTAYRTNNSSVSCIGTIHKYSANNLTFELASVDPLTEQVEYFIRYEATFLLSNNLAGN